VISVAHLTLEEMLGSMDLALSDELKAQSKRPAQHVAINGTLLSEQSGLFIYVFTLCDPWEPQDDTPLKIKINRTQELRGTIVTSTGTTITIAIEEALPVESLNEIALIDDPSQLLERLREALKSSSEEVSQLGSKTFGLLPFSTGKRISPEAFGMKFTPDSSQEQAIQMALGSEVTYIVGPPGTGKTSTLAAIAFAHMRLGRTVLIAAHTNIAVDNAVMRLADICTDAHATLELRIGQIIRYGVPQLEARLKSEYGEVHLPTIVARRIGNLDEHRNELQTYLDQIDADLVRLDQEKAHITEQWQSQRQHFIHERDVLKSQLQPLITDEQQRMTALDTKLQHLHNQLTQQQKYIHGVNQEMAQVSAAQVQQMTVRSQLLAQVNNISAELAAAQQMHALVRFFKGIDQKSLAQQLADKQHQGWNCDKTLSELHYQLSGLHSARAVAEQRLQQVTSEFRTALMQRNTPSPTAQRIQQLQVAITGYEQQIKHCDTSLKQSQEVVTQKYHALISKQERTRTQLEAIASQSADIEKSIVADARVIATTLCKTYMNANLRERRFDVVIMDEVSMAPLPAVYIAASRADSCVVAVGDPRQLAPIYLAESSRAAQEWLGRDLFELRNITLEDAASLRGNSILLEQQARMHPHISHIARKHVYRGLIKDRLIDAGETYASVEPLPGKALLLCDTSDANPFALKPEGGSRINTYHTLCTFEIARRVLASLPPPKKPLQVGEFRIGLVTPYRKQAELLQHLILDAGLKDLIRAGTVHRFQGLEAEVIIFDTVESPPLSPPEFTSGQLGSKAMRLVNVAVTRAQHKLIIVANSQYVQSNFNEQDTLRLAVQEAQRAGTIFSRDIFDIASTTSVEKSRNEIQTLHHLTLVNKIVPAYETEFLDERTFYERFLEDVRSANKQVVIFSPFLRQNRIQQMGQILSEKHDEGVRIIAFTSLSRDVDPAMSNEGMMLKKLGVELRTAFGMHEKLVFIDEDIVYIGSLNVLSQRGTTEFMERVQSPSFAKKLKQIRHIDTLIDAPTRWGQTIEIQSHKLPKANCRNCGKTLKVRDGRYGAFYGCTGYPKCTFSEDIAEKHLRSVQELANIRCGGCGERTDVKTVRKDAWLVCAAPTPCGYGQHIKVVK
jgi:DNA replication protein DnaC